MSEKEIKKIDESSEEKVSGGSKIDRKNLDFPKRMPAIEYGVFKVKVKDILERLKEKHNDDNKKEEGSSENPQTALTTSQPQTEEKK